MKYVGYYVYPQHNQCCVLLSAFSICAENQTIHTPYTPDMYIKVCALHTLVLHKNT